LVVHRLDIEGTPMWVFDGREARATLRDHKRNKGKD
jgi:hypothetical protein